MESEETFQLEHKDMRSIPYNNHWQKTISYEVSLDQLVYQRIVYSKLDFLRDMGGLTAAMNALFYGLIVVTQYRGAMYFLMTETFATPSQRAANMKDVKLGRKESGLKVKDRREFNKVQMNCCRVIRTNWQINCPIKCCRFCLFK